MSVSVPTRLAPFSSAAEIAQLVAAFESKTLPRSAWTHQAHLTVAAWYLSQHSVQEAIPLIRNGILALNAALGIVNDANTGYHETITQFYIGMIAHHLRTMECEVPLLEAVNSLLSVRGQKELPLDYYSRSRLMSRKARAAWLPPDLKPLEWYSPTDSEDRD